MEPTTRRIVRFLATDLDGNMRVDAALRRIKGINFMLSNAVCLATKIDARKKIGTLNDSELKTLENAIKNPAFPPWMLNRRKDAESGNDVHLVGSDLDLRKRDDINFMKRIRSYKGVRHEFGLPVRGQRTRSSFRTQKTVGVSKKGAKQAAAPAAAPKAAAQPKAAGPAPKAAAPAAKPAPAKK
jgi:small subunit ribosomal protein S13